jgi:hypothetical protein
MGRARAPVKGAFGTLNGKPSDVALVDDGNGCAGKDLPDPSERSEQGRVMLNRYGSEGTLKIVNLCGSPSAHPDEVGKAEGREKSCRKDVRHFPYERGRFVFRRMGVQRANIGGDSRHCIHANVIDGGVHASTDHMILAIWFSAKRTRKRFWVLRVIALNSFRPVIYPVIY